jgi:hypothetical protein
VAAVVLIEAVAIVLLVVLVAGLLRSHADILRALHRLGVDLEGVPTATPTDGLRVGRRPGGPTGVGALSLSPGRAAVDLSGVSPADEAVRIAVTEVRHDTLLAFLTTGCTTCTVFWEALAHKSLVVPGGARVVIVVHDPGEESLSRVRSLAPRQVPVLMSSGAWEDYDVAFAPHFVYVSGPAGRVIGEGSAGTWGELSSLLGQAIGDGAASQTRAARDRDRSGRIDDELAQAGIVPGDPQLYPTHLDTGPTRTEGRDGAG